MCEVLVDGWLYIGDFVCIDCEGFIYLVDCKYDMIILGGFNVYLIEVEVVLYWYESVFEVCVVGVLDDKWGEVVKVVVVLCVGYVV